MRLPENVRRWPWDLLLIMALAAALRLLLLDLRAPHFDEGVNGWFADQMRETGTFRYNPENFHGPWHFYTVFLSQELLGRNLWALRWPAVLASVLTVPALFLFGRWFGRCAVRWAALAFAVSPAGLYYGRYSIHESWFVLFTIIFTWGVLALWQDRDRAGLWATVLGLTGMIINKETYIVHTGSLALAAGVFALWGKVSPVHPPRQRAKERGWSSKDARSAGAVAAFLLVFFYSGNFLHPPGLFGPFQALFEWTKTGAAGNGHEKDAYDLLPFVNYYWLALLARYEWPALTGLVWSVRYAWPGPAVPRLLAILGGGVLLAYSLVPYKTPWCLAAIMWPWFIFFGAAVAAAGRRWTNMAAALLLAASLTQAVRLNFLRFEADDEPYVYVPTYRAMAKFTGPLLELAAADPRRAQTAGAIYLESYYPLPWVLGAFPNIGYHGGEIPADLPDAQFHVVESEKADIVRAKLGPGYEELGFRVRSGVGDCVVFLAPELAAAMRHPPRQRPPRKGEP